MQILSKYYLNNDNTYYLHYLLSVDTLIELIVGVSLQVSSDSVLSQPKERRKCRKSSAHSFQNTHNSPTMLEPPSLHQPFLQFLFQFPNPRMLIPGFTHPQ